MPTEVELQQLSWCNAIVGVLRVTQHASKGDDGWAMLGRWTQETKGWGIANVLTNP